MIKILILKFIKFYRMFELISRLPGQAYDLTFLRYEYLSRRSTPMPKHELRGVHFVLIFSCSLVVYTCIA